MMYQYDFNQTELLINNMPITAFGQGDGVITIERAEDSMLFTIGADGSTTYTKNTNKNGTVTITLQQGSESGYELAKLWNAQETDILVPIFFQFSDINSGDSASGSGVIQSYGGMTRGVNQNDETWTLHIANLVLVKGNGAKVA